MSYSSDGLNDSDSKIRDVMDGVKVCPECGGSGVHGTAPFQGHVCQKCKGSGVNK